MAQQICPQVPIQLTYWKMRGAAQPVRHLFQYLKIPYIQKYQQLPQTWQSYDITTIKKKCISARLPSINDGGMIIHELIPIMKYLCRKYNKRNLLGKDLLDEVKIDQIVGKLLVYRNKVCDIFHHQCPEDPYQKKLFLEKKLQQLTSNSYFKFIYKKLSNKDWIFGYLTILDFLVYQNLFYFSGVFPQIQNDYKLIKDFKYRFEQIDEIKQYMNSERMMVPIFMNPVIGMKAIWKGNQKYIR